MAAFFMLLILFSGMTVQASDNVGNVATAIENTWQTAADQIKTVVNNIFKTITSKTGQVK